MSAPAGIRPDLWAAMRSCRLWSRASDEAVEQLAKVGHVSAFARGDRLVTEGEPATRFGVVVTGTARVFYLGADGRQITFEMLDAGAPVAAVAALAGGRYPANIDAAADCTVAWLSRGDLFALLDAEPIVAHSLIADLASHVVSFTGVVQTLALDVPGRLARYLFQRTLQSGTPTETGMEIELGMKKSDLAAALGTVPETLSRALARLRDDGVIDVEGRRVLVRDVRRLAELASGYDRQHG